ncbi:MAG: transcription elongation factor GreA [Clostridia bacterium]|nr:transcription elongation factor GreA [Clostridia bacterium]
MAQKMMYTQEGYDELVKEYKFLTTEKREQVRHAIDEARSFGDLSENSEYDEARNEQAKTEARIAELKEMMENAIIVDEAKLDASVISLGSYVKAYDKEFDEEVVYTIVGSNEANPMEGKISDLSPIGRALIGKQAGDVVTVVAPGGTIELKVLEVSRAQK